MMLDAQLPLFDVLLVEERLAAIRPDAADRALEVGPNFEGDGGVSRANAAADGEFSRWSEDRRNGGKGVTRGRLAAKRSREEEHDEPNPKDDGASEKCVLDDAHGGIIPALAQEPCSRPFGPPNM